MPELGAEVLLGFQLRSAFQEAFDALPAASRTLDAVALMLMLLVVGLLIAPSIHHRVVDDGDARARTQLLVGRVMAAALIPFALSLAFNIFIVVERAASHSVAVLAAVGAGGRGPVVLVWHGIARAAA
jgi:Na+/proline symporter